MGSNRLNYRLTVPHMWARCGQRWAADGLQSDMDDGVFVVACALLGSMDAPRPAPFYPPLTTPHLSLLQVGCDSHSFAAAELVVMGSCTSGSARSKTSFSLLRSFWRNGCGISSTEVATHPNAQHGVSVFADEILRVGNELLYKLDVNCNVL